MGTDGTIDWYCCPSFDAPSVFASVLDAVAARVPALTKQFYFPDINVLITRFFTETVSATCRTSRRSTATRWRPSATG